MNSNDHTLPTADILRSRVRAAKGRRPADDEFDLDEDLDEEDSE